jgi:hypothetical protein
MSICGLEYGAEGAEVKGRGVKLTGMAVFGLPDVMQWRTALLIPMAFTAFSQPAFEVASDWG